MIYTTLTLEERPSFISFFFLFNGDCNHLGLRKVEYTEEDQYGFRKGKGTRDAIGVLRTIAERYMKRNVYVVFIDLEKAFDSAKWNKLIKLLKEKD